jgi:hypothetical protein
LIPEYKTIQEKAENFKIIEITTEKDVDNLIEEHKNKKGIYRGVSSWKYKIYSSLQRQCLLNNIQIDESSKFINDYIKVCREDSLFSKYLNSFKITPSKLSIMAYLQHFGAPTSLIDFSTNIYKSLYFAIEKFTKKEHDLKENFSLCFIDKNDLELINIDNVFEGIAERKSYFENASKAYGEDLQQEKFFRIEDDLFDLSVLDVFLVEHKNELAQVYNTYNNIRIIAQEGLFINNSHQNLPLENSLKEFFIEATQYQYSPLEETPEAENYYKEEEKRIKENKPLQERLEKNIITSYEISPKLVKYLYSIINLSESDIYPQEENLVQGLFDKHMNK